MSLLSSHRLLSTCGTIHQRFVPCFLAHIQQRRQIGLYKRYESYLERRYPRVYKVHRLVVDGCSLCAGDIKNYFLIRRDLKNGKRSVSDLSESELLSYIQCPPELLKLITVLFILQFPGVGELTALAAVFFPRFIFTRHFWTETQKQKFWQQFFKESHLPKIQTLAQLTCPKYVKTIPVPKCELTNIKMPDLNDLNFKHLIPLFRLHNISLFAGTNGLKRHVTLLAQLDRVLEDQDSIERLTDIELKNHLYIRRLEFTGKSTEEMKQLLRDWTFNLKDLSSEPTLYLHAPVLFQNNK